MCEAEAPMASFCSRRHPTNRVLEDPELVRMQGDVSGSFLQDGDVDVDVALEAEVAGCQEWRQVERVPLGCQVPGQSNVVTSSV